MAKTEMTVEFVTEPGGQVAIGWNEVPVPESEVYPENPPRPYDEAKAPEGE